jgi:DNA-binding response OmpR family regulator
MTKPFSSDELMWRIGALMRRADIAQNKKIEIGSVTVDSKKYAVYTDNEYIEFPKKEFDLLFKLLSYPDRIFSKEQLLDSVWGVNAETGEETVKTHMSRIRNRLKNIDEIKIVTLKGLGYKADINKGGK